MDDSYITQVMRHCGKCASDILTCEGCPADRDGCANVYLAAADRLEALLTENERLKEQMPKWCPVSEPPKATGEYLVDMTAYLGGTKRHQEVLHFTTARKPFIPAGSWYKIDDFGYPEIVRFKDIISWMPLPSTEEVPNENP